MMWLLLFVQLTIAGDPAAVFARFAAIARYKVCFGERAPMRTPPYKLALAIWRAPGSSGQRLAP